MAYEQLDLIEEVTAMTDLNIMKFQILIKMVSLN